MKVLVIGGGAAGMMAALGYDVVAVPSGTDVEGSFRLDS